MRCTIRPTAAGENADSPPAAAKLPLRRRLECLDAVEKEQPSHVERDPFGKPVPPFPGHARTLRKTDAEGKNNSFCAGRTGGQNKGREIPMTPLTIAALGALMVGTRFLSGCSAGPRLILIGVLLILMPLPTAMVLQRSRRWLQRLARVPVARAYPLATGLGLPDRLRAGARAWSLMRYVPGQAGGALVARHHAVMARALPSGIRPNPTACCRARSTARLHGAVLMTGVSGRCSTPSSRRTFRAAARHRHRRPARSQATSPADFIRGIIDQAATLVPVLALVASRLHARHTLSRRVLER